MNRAKWKFIVAGAGIGLLYAANFMAVQASHDDACLVIAMDLAEQMASGESVSKSDIEAVITRLIRSSVIHGDVDSSNDLNGNPYLVEINGRSVTVCTRLSLFQPIRSCATRSVGSRAAGG